MGGGKTLISGISAGGTLGWEVVQNKFERDQEVKTNRTAGWTTNLEDSQSKALTLLMKGEQDMDTHRCVTVLVVCPYVLRTPRIRLGRRLCAIFRA